MSLKCNNTTPIEYSIENWTKNLIEFYSMYIEFEMHFEKSRQIVYNVQLSTLSLFYTICSNKLN